MRFIYYDIVNKEAILNVELKMATKQYIELLHNQIKYKINFDKLLYILSCLENSKILNITDENIKTLLDKYGLMDETFLENINSIW